MIVLVGSSKELIATNRRRLVVKYKHAILILLGDVKTIKYFLVVPLTPFVGTAVTFWVIKMSFYLFLEFANSELKKST